MVHLGSINSNNWLPLLAFRKRLIGGEVAPESSTSGVASTEEGSETATVCGIRKTVCRPISAAKKQQILGLEPTGSGGRYIHFHGEGCLPPSQATTPPQAALHGRRPPACTAAPRPGPHLHRDRAGTWLRTGYGEQASGGGTGLTDGWGSGDRQNRYVATGLSRCGRRLARQPFLRTVSGSDL